ncbi:MAG: TraC family protein [Luteolibacter sp.]
MAKLRLSCIHDKFHNQSRLAFNDTLSARPTYRTLPSRKKENLMAPRNSKSASEQIHDIEAQIAKLHQRKKEVLKKQSERVAKLVMESGLADLHIDEAELSKALSEVAARFQNSPPPQTNTPAPQN